jgi:hypothetical protein
LKHPISQRWDKVDIIHTISSTWSPVKGIIERIRLKIKQPRASEPEKKPYFRVRFRWWQPFDLEEYAGEYGDRYEIEVRPLHVGWGKIDIFADTRREFRVRADTLNAFLTVYKAILFQKEAGPLSPRDRELRDYILEKYPHARDTPLI